MKKKLLVTMLIMLGLAVPGMASEEDFVFDDYEYMLTQYAGSGGDVVIPDELLGCPVEGIASSVFYGNTDITSLQLPQPLLALGNSCIYSNENLTEVTIPEALIVIDDYNFYSCPQIAEVVIPEKVSFIGTYSFAFCDNLRSVTFEGEVPYIGSECFTGLAEDVVFYVPDDRVEEYAAVLPEGAEICPSGNLVEVCDFVEADDMFEFDAETGTITGYYGYGTRVDIPETIGGVPVTAIGESVFESHHYLYYVTIPEGVTEIGANAFSSVHHLKYVDLPDTLKVIGSGAFMSFLGEEMHFPESLEEIGDSAFYYSDLSRNIVLPEGLKHIGSEAFYSTRAAEVYFPESLETIGNNAFENSYLTYLYFEAKDLPEIGQDAFLNTTIYDVDINWEASKEQMYAAQEYFDSIGQSTRVWRCQNPYTNLIGYENGAEYADGMLVAYTGAETDVRPYTTMDDVLITGVGEGAFRGNQVVRYFSVDYSDEFTTIGAEAFADSTLEVVDLFDSVTDIGAGAFRNCVNLTELELPESVVTIGEEAFAGCSGLKKVTILCDPSVIPEGAFEGCTALEEVYVAEDAADETVEAAKAAVGLKWYYKAARIGEAITNQLVTMPYAETNADEFWYDEEFKRLDMYEGYEVNLYLPREVDGIPMEMIGGGLMGRSVLYDGEEDVELPVRSVVIPETVKEIASYAFASCPTLETVICYAPIEAIEDLAFSGCTNLREVIFVNGVRNIGSMSFADCPALETVYVGEFVESISEDAFSGSSITAENCIRTVEELPDVNVLLEAVKGDPITPPETEPPVELEAFDAELAKPYVGFWELYEIIMGEDAYAPEDFGMAIEFTLLDDGTAVLTMDEETAEAEWSLLNGMAAIVYDGELFLQAELTDENTLVHEEDEEMAMVFIRTEGEAAVSVPVPEAETTENMDMPAEAPETADDVASDNMTAAGDEQYLGQKHICKNAKISGIMMDASALGGEYSVTFHADGTLDFVMAGANVPGLTWKSATVQTENGEAAAYVVTYFDGTDLNFVLTDTGFELDFYGSMLMYFEK